MRKVRRRNIFKEKNSIAVESSKYLTLSKIVKLSKEALKAKDLNYYFWALKVKVSGKTKGSFWVVHFHSK